MRSNLLPRRRPRKPSRTERRFGLILIVVLAFVVAFFAWTGTRSGPPSLAAANAWTVPATGASIDGAEERAGGTLPGTSPAGWPRGAVETYDASTLFEKINGKADAYLAYDFRVLDFAEYTDPTDADTYVDVYAYRMQTPLDAFGAYRAQRSGKETALDAGEEGVLAGGAVFLRQGPVYLELMASNESARAEARALASALARHLPASDPALDLPVGLPEDAFVRYARGGALGVEGFPPAFVATDAAGTRYVLARAATADQARDAARRAEDDLDFLGEAATFLASDRRIVGVVGPEDGAGRRALAERLLGAQPPDGDAADEEAR